MPISYKDLISNFYDGTNIPSNNTRIDDTINYKSNNNFFKDLDSDIEMEDVYNNESSDYKTNEYNIVNNIIQYINSIKKDNYPIFIIDGENLIVGPPQYRTCKVNRVFSRLNNKTVILVVKKSGGTRRFKNYTGVDVPEHFIFVSLHADNKTCPDDGFILELAKKYGNSIVITDDEYINRENFNYGDLNIGTKLTSNIGIQGRYIPDIEKINRSIIRRQYITRKS